MNQTPWESNQPPKNICWDCGKTVVINVGKRSGWGYIRDDSTRRILGYFHICCQDDEEEDLV